MSNKLDKQYQELLQDILDNGVKKEDRTGTGTLSVFGRQIRHKMSDGFPLLTTKKIHFKSVVVELLYFLKGNPSIKYMVDNGCNIWNGDLSKYHELDSQDYLGKAKDDINLYEGGALYPHQWRNFGSDNFTRKRITEPFRSSFLRESSALDLDDPHFDKIYKTKDYGEYFILERLKIGEKNQTHYKIQFLETNSIKIIRGDKIGTNIYDPYMKSKLGVACMGEYKKFSHLNLGKIKNIWNGMIDRCYDTKNPNYPYYGGKGVYVDNRWLCFEYFVSDIQKLKNWNLKIENWAGFELDKDLYGDGFIYSLESCCWASKSDNSKKSKEKYKYTITNGMEHYTFVNHVDFMDKMGIKNQGNFSAMLRGERPICEGWSLVSKSKIDNGVDQISDLIKTLKNNPDSRRMMVTAWNPSHLDKVCLPPCHYGFQVYTRELSWEEQVQWVMKNTNVELENLYIVEEVAKYSTPKRAISLMWNQRSVDTFLGLPFNIASYGLLLEIIAKEVNMVPDELIGNLGDTHLYLNHIEQAKEQIGRKLTVEERMDWWFKNRKPNRDVCDTVDEYSPYAKGVYFDSIGVPNSTKEPFDLPKLFIDKFDEDNHYIGDMDDISEYNIEQFKLENYQSHPSIKAPLSN